MWVGYQKQAIYRFRGTDPALDQILSGDVPSSLESRRPRAENPTRTSFLSWTRLSKSRIRLAMGRCDEAIAGLRRAKGSPSVSRPDTAIARSSLLGGPKGDTLSVGSVGSEPALFNEPRRVVLAQCRLDCLSPSPEMRRNLRIRLRVCPLRGACRAGGYLSHSWSRGAVCTRDMPPD